MSVRFPTPLAIDPWWDLYMPASFGERASVEHAVDHLPDDAAVQAVAVRTLMLLGRLREATVRWRRIRDAPEVEVAALAVVLEPAPDRWLARLAHLGASPGRVVDALCDRAARALVEGERAAAEAAVRRGVEAPMDHAEAGHWARFLADAPDPVGIYRRAVAGRSGPGDPVADVGPLVIRASNGWLSGERLMRRFFGAPVATPPAGSALAALAERGVPGGQFADLAVLARLPATDRLVELEALADLVASVSGEGRDATGLALRLHRVAHAAGPGQERDADAILTRLARRDPRMRGVGREASLRRTAG